MHFVQAKIFLPAKSLNFLLLGLAGYDTFY